MLTLCHKVSYELYVHLISLTLPCGRLAVLLRVVRRALMPPRAWRGGRAWVQTQALYLQSLSSSLPLL